jgi:hypothetical protein
MKNHFRAHQLSIWLRLIPEIHKLGAGMEDVLSRHNLFKNHDDMSLYDGHVRPDLFARFPIFDENYKRRNNITNEFNGVYYGNVFFYPSRAVGQSIKRCEQTLITLNIFSSMLSLSKNRSHYNGASCAHHVSAY